MSMRRTSCTTPHSRAILSNRDRGPATRCPSANLPEVQADGNDNKIATLGRVSDSFASSSLLFLSACAIGNFALAEQRNRWRR